jgi:hypothetical protein
MTIDGNVIVTGTTTSNASMLVGSVHLAGSLTVDVSATVQVLGGGTLWGAGGITLSPNSGLFTSPGNTFVSSIGDLTGSFKIGTNTNGYTPINAAGGGTFTLNGTTQVNVTGVFPANAPVALSLNTVGSTPGPSIPYFSQAQIANNFYVKSGTVSANDVYNWQALPASVALTAANMDLYGGLNDPATGARFCLAQ